MRVCVCVCLCGNRRPLRRLVSGLGTGRAPPWFWAEMSQHCVLAPVAVPALGPKLTALPHTPRVPLAPYWDANAQSCLNLQFLPGNVIPISQSRGRMSMRDFFFPLSGQTGKIYLAQWPKIPSLRLSLVWTEKQECGQVKILIMLSAEDQKWEKRPDSFYKLLFSIINFPSFVHPQGDTVSTSLLALGGGGESPFA